MMPEGAIRSAQRKKFRTREIQTISRIMEIYNKVECEEFPDLFGELRPPFAALEDRPFAPTLPK
jgi:hypothetical protein